MAFIFKKYFMRKIGIAFITFLFFNSKLIAQIDPVPPHDSTVLERFLMCILKEYPAEGRWVFAKVESSYKLKNNFEVIDPINIYNSLSEGFTSYNKSRFIFHVYSLLRDELVLQRNGEYKTQIKGVKVNLRRYKTILKQRKEKILVKYFDNNRKLKPEYVKWLYEIIAVCYTNNIKVITPSNAKPYYEVFK
jgi:hypothetical protein